MMNEDYQDPFEEDEEERMNKLLLLALFGDGDLDEDMQEELDQWLDSIPGYRRTFDILMDPRKRRILMEKFSRMPVGAQDSPLDFPLEFSLN